MSSNPQDVLTSVPGPIVTRHCHIILPLALPRVDGPKWHVFTVSYPCLTFKTLEVFKQRSFIAETKRLTAVQKPFLIAQRVTGYICRGEKNP